MTPETRTGGVSGFLSAGYMAPSCRGNWALGDIAAALEFLRQTVHDFNGDRNKITLLGWDTGAALVNLLMSSPVSAPSNSRSFQRAILLGGSALSSWALVKNPSEIFTYVAQGLTCPPFNTPGGKGQGAATGPGRRPLQPQDAWQWKAETESLLQVGLSLNFPHFDISCLKISRLAPDLNVFFHYINYPL